MVQQLRIGIVVPSLWLTHLLRVTTSCQGQLMLPISITNIYKFIDLPAISHKNPQNQQKHLRILLVEKCTSTCTFCQTLVHFCQNTCGFLTKCTSFVQSASFVISLLCEMSGNFSIQTRYSYIQNYFRGLVIKFIFENRPRN